MKYSIRNDLFTLSALTMGAELTSFSDRKDGYEYIWQKCEIWQGQAPLLFPIVGKLKDDELKLNGKAYNMPKHGFAKNTEFCLESISRTDMTFLFTSNEETKKNYPFDFELRVRYELLQRGFVMEHRVRNIGSGPMYFSLGAHPAFRIALGDRVETEKNETVGAWRLGEEKLIRPEQTDVFKGGNSFTITPDTFRDDAYIFEGLDSCSASVIKKDGRNVNVEFGGAPCIGMWAKPGAPYVCIEPWYGLDDKWNAEGGFESKPYVQRLENGKEFVFRVRVHV